MMESLHSVILMFLYIIHYPAYLKSPLKNTILFLPARPGANSIETEGDLRFSIPLTWTFRQTMLFDSCSKYIYYVRNAPFIKSIGFLNYSLLIIQLSFRPEVFRHGFKVV